MGAHMLQSNAQKALRSVIEKIENLQAQQRDLGEDIREILHEAKGTGFDPKIIRKVLAIRRKTRAEHEAEEAVIATYLEALGMEGTPLGDYAKRQELIAAE